MPFSRGKQGFFVLSNQKNTTKNQKQKTKQKSNKNK